MDREKLKKAFGWMAVLISTAFSSFWAFWGINENFHEGWYFKSFWNNILLMFAQYMFAAILFMALSMIALRWQKVGGIVHIIVGIFLAWFLSGMKAAIIFIMFPFVILGLLYYFSIVSNKRIAFYMLLGVPLLIILGFGIFNGVRVAGRFNDDNLDARVIKGNGVELMWAPAGPGWPDNGTSWDKAKDICAHLREDGKTLSDSVLNIWRLPTINEGVRSMVYHGQNAGGVYDSTTKTANYQFQPDKESPLWYMYSKVIYWWTSEEQNDKNAYIVVYNGGVYPRLKAFSLGYLGFRAVKNIK